MPISSPNNILTNYETNYNVKQMMRNAKKLKFILFFSNERNPYRNRGCG